MGVKAIFGQDMRRLRVQWQRGSDQATIFKSILSVVLSSFKTRLSEAPPVLMYVDEDGDLCTLVATTVDDCLSLSRNGTVKLQIRDESNSSLTSSNDDEQKEE